MANKRVWRKKLSFLMVSCILMTLILSATTVNGYAAPLETLVYGGVSGDGHGGFSDHLLIKRPALEMAYEEIPGYYILKTGEFVIQSNEQFKEWFMYIWDHNPIPEREISDEEFKSKMLVGVAKDIGEPLSDRLTLQKISYSGGKYSVYYNYSPISGSARFGVYRMALVKKLPFTKVDFYENGILVNTITP